MIMQGVLDGIVMKALEVEAMDDGGDMYLIDLLENPYELTTCPDAKQHHPSCSNLYHNESYADVRNELMAIMSKVRSGLSPWFWAALR